jgi:molybdate transport system substrate-binding protein
MKKVFFVLLLCLCASAAVAQEIAVAAAADLSSVFPQIAARFEKETGRKVRVSYGSSGQFFLQIENGAPYDLFFSADLEYPRRLAAEGFADAGTIQEYAVGKVVLYVPNGSKVDPAEGLRVLLSPQLSRIAIANPTHAPYGRAAVEALKSAGLYEPVKSKLVMGENISQAAQFVQSGNAEAGLIALSLASSPAMRSAGRFAELPLSSYTPLQQAAVILKNSHNRNGAELFLAYLRRPEIAALLVRYGFTRPAGGAIRGTSSR